VGPHMIPPPPRVRPHMIPTVNVGVLPEPPAGSLQTVVPGVKGVSKGKITKWEGGRLGTKCRLDSKLELGRSFDEGTGLMGKGATELEMHGKEHLKDQVRDEDHITVADPHRVHDPWHAGAKGSSRARAHAGLSPDSQRRPHSFRMLSSAAKERSAAAKSSTLEDVIEMRAKAYISMQSSTLPASVNQVPAAVPASVWQKSFSTSVQRASAYVGLGI
jgi:hypothetical protein